MPRTLAPWALAAILLASLLTGASSASQSTSLKPEYIPFSAAQPILHLFSGDLAPDLAQASARPANWMTMVARRDADIRARLARGDEDSLANLLLYGTSFTRQPRLTAEYFAQLEGQDDSTSSLRNVLQARVNDLVDAMATASASERLRFMRAVVEERSLSFRDDASRLAIKQYLMSNLARVRREYAEYSNTMREAHASGDATAEFAARSHIFSNRGLSLDTSLPPNFAIEQALEQMKSHHLLAPGSVRRVAVIGPGLDFVDKDEGYDFYPVQSIQPFAVLDSLLRLGLSRSDTVQVDTLDLSRRINQHLAFARQRALHGQGYTLQLVRQPSRKWQPDLVAYWRKFGSEIGDAVAPVEVPSVLPSVEMRAVRVSPKIVSRITARDLDVVWQRYDLPPGQRYDLVIATNILVYYTPVEQSLAASNIGSMLAPSGFLLSNNVIPEVPSARLKSVGYSTSVYSDGFADGDRIVWYKHVGR